MATRQRLLPSSSDDSLHAPPLPPLPFDLGVEILCRLSVKSLLQLRCVCKSWKTLISDPKFAKHHLLRSSPTDFTRHRLILGYNILPNDRFKFLLKDYPLLSVFNAAMPAPATELGYPLRDNFNLIMDSCDGIVLVCANYKRCIVLWNPSTRRFKELPRLEIPESEVEGASTFITYGFGYDNLADSYKVVAVFYYETDTGGYRKNKTNFEFYKTQVKVHTLGTHSWREIQEFPSCVPFTGAGRFVSGTVNWLVSDESNWFINSLDLGKESYQKLLPPNDGSEPENYLGVLRDCLCVLCGDSKVWNVWLMMEYGNQKSWTKLFSVATELFPYYKGQGLGAIHISEDDQVLVVQFCSELFLYNSKDGTLKSLQIQIPDACISMVSWVYVESLVSPCF
ncbi:F-box/kelch-repeat protein At3g23880-like [Lotus japonicus]|uniref:F-box/kelch-repeat protein At3g23880-like n=1 Tax=Lotus japonicus TaxID=34305 RepID=UPI002590F90F|nr:F-box/kelch-repeat protein At3g23880-like [Lotus japonicus]XP_057430900.1 F-box/kelch-repeat protein At3g23880-like [Lotus japonicus]